MEIFLDHFIKIFKKNRNSKKFTQLTSDSSFYNYSDPFILSKIGKQKRFSYKINWEKDQVFKDILREYNELDDKTLDEIVSGEYNYDEKPLELNYPTSSEIEDRLMKKLKELINIEDVSVLVGEELKFITIHYKSS